MKSSDHGYFAQLTYDVRVRERLLSAGIVTPADIERYLAELPELETQAEALGIEQPALGAVAASPAPAAAAAAAPVQSPAAPMTDGSSDNDDDDDESETT
ncbi:hypothetical protein [Polyangium aurulentum]|uniref:hypothetical protein n=1 Tax=Polyangium aurulentum TaxID=2567896 RepID=UPI0010AEE38D|nr:hypothetical protein [Polyangium aurulentum]UQA62284.1 hypothetical protein E8A73_018175 [Polyangium aurulentum]